MILKNYNMEIKEIILEESSEEAEESISAEEAAAVAAEIEPFVVSEEEGALPVEGTSFEESNLSDAITDSIDLNADKINSALDTLQDFEYRWCWRSDECIQGCWCERDVR